MGIRQRVYWAMALVLCWTVLGSRGLAAGRYRVVLTPALPGSISEGGFAIVAVEVKDASGVSVPLYLSQISATWDGEPATLVPADVGWPSFLAAYIPPSQFNSKYLKSLQKDASFLTDESIARVFQSPHTKFWMRKNNLKSGKTWVSVTTALPTETVSGSLALTVSTQAVSATQVPDVKFSVNPDPIDPDKPFTILATMVAPDVDELALCFQGGSITGFGTPPGTLVARFGNVIHFGSSRVFPQGSQIAIGIDPTLPPASLCGSSTCAKPNQYPVSGTVHRACCFFLRGAGACFDIAPRAQGGLRVNISPSSVKLRPGGAGDPHSTLFTILVSDAAGNPKANQPLKIKVSVPTGDLIALGGHSHHGNIDELTGKIHVRPLGVFENPPGTLFHVSNGKLAQQDVDEFQAATDSNGKLIMNYVAPTVGGLVILEVTPVSGSLAQGSTNRATIDVRVPDLAPLPDNPELYTKTGGTSFHPGPPGSKFDGNHWGIIQFNEKLMALTKDFVSGITSENGTRITFLFPPPKVLVNDMSLPKGGLFDIGPLIDRFGRPTCFADPGGRIPCNFWDQPHIFHRLGTSCDYNTERGLTGVQGSPEEVILLQLIRHYGLSVIQEGDHWHIYDIGGGPRR